MMKAKDSRIVSASKITKEKQSCAVDDIIEEKLEEIVTILYSAGLVKKSKVYEEIMSIIEKSLFKIALRHTNNVKSTAAAYLGINRNTFQSKMIKLGINNGKINKK